MKRFRTVSHHRRVAWPEAGKKAGSHLFAPRARLRKLIVMVDADLLSSTRSTPIVRNELLSGLLESRLIELHRYLDEGPPGTVAPVELPSLGATPGYEGWAVVTCKDTDGEIWPVIYQSAPGSWGRSAVTGDIVAMAADDVRSAAYEALDEESAGKCRKADGLAASIASQVLAADIYVTEREYLHQVSWNIAPGVALCRPDDALPLVALYLRAQDEFMIDHNLNFNRGLYYWVGAREILPASWRWFSACVQHDTGNQDSPLVLLAQSVLQRVVRALEARDGVLVAHSQPQDNDTRREILARLDDVLVDLMGAVDAAARVAHRVLGLPAGNEFMAAWQRKEWLSSVAKEAAPLAEVLTAGSPGSWTLEILRRLRNSVHGTALQSLALQEASAREERSMIAIPPTDVPDLITAMDALGGHPAWGAQRLMPNQVHLDADVFVEALLPHVISLLNELMSRTPVERLDNVALTEAHSRPPVSDSSSIGVWDHGVRTSIRWQLGL